MYEHKIWSVSNRPDFDVTAVGMTILVYGPPSRTISLIDLSPFVIFFEKSSSA